VLSQRPAFSQVRDAMCAHEEAAPRTAKVVGRLRGNRPNGVTRSTHQAGKVHVAPQNATTVSADRRVQVVANGHFRAGNGAACTAKARGCGGHVSDPRCGSISACSDVPCNNGTGRRSALTTRRGGGHSMSICIIALGRRCIFIRGVTTGPAGPLAPRRSGD